jgi:hypothetical protein
MVAFHGIDDCQIPRIIGFLTLIISIIDDKLEFHELPTHYCHNITSYHSSFPGHPSAYLM